MKHFALALITSLVFVSSAASAAAPADPVAEVTAFEMELMGVYNDFSHNGKVDAEKALSYFDNSDDVSLFDIMPPRQSSGAEFRKHFRELTEKFIGRIEFHDMKVHADKKLAFVTMVQHYFGKDEKGKNSEMIFRVTDCLKKKDGKWRIVHEHLSFPVDLATGKADFLSKP